MLLVPIPVPDFELVEDIFLGVDLVGILEDRFCCEGFWNVLVTGVLGPVFCVRFVLKEESKLNE